MALHRGGNMTFSNPYILKEFRTTNQSLKENVKALLGKAGL